MSKELKARITDPEKIEEQLKQLGAMFTHEDSQEYIYFKQPEGKVLKLATRDGKTYKTVIERRGNQFAIVSNDEIAEPAAAQDELTKQYGVKRALTNDCKFFTLGNDTVSINKIAGVGDFLIIEAEEPSSKLLEQLGISKDAIVTDSFDNL